jgi:hypothetical protein
MERVKVFHNGVITNVSSCPQVHPSGKSFTMCDGEGKVVSVELNEPVSTAASLLVTDPLETSNVI